MLQESIVVTARVGFAAVDQIADRMRDVDFPVELALPHKFEWWADAVSQWDEMLSRLDEANLTVNTVHATQAPITDKAFLEWGRLTIRIAEHFEAKAITVHPNRVSRKRKNDMQELARLYLRRLRHETEIPISVETFTGTDRVFVPEEIMEARLPMTLDTAHIHDNARIMRIIDSYWRNIPVLHLSARGRENHHLPVNQFCIQVVRRLVELGWSGSIALEYLYEYHDLLQSDIGLVQTALVEDIRVDEFRRSDEAK
jgi:sugar phosphate isomerase/epimerase